MTTLVIHPTDYTTDFLKEIYRGKDWTVVTDNLRHNELAKLMIDHDRIIMLGHGCDAGLFDGRGQLVINSKLVYLLRTKDIVAIWCNADVFVKKYNLKGLYTGMIVSELNEAVDFAVPATNDTVEISNKLFALAMRTAIDTPDDFKHQVALNSYQSNINHVIDFNRQNIYYNGTIL